MHGFLLFFLLQRFSQWMKVWRAWWSSFEEQCGSFFPCTRANKLPLMVDLYLFLIFFLIFLPEYLPANPLSWAELSLWTTSFLHKDIWPYKMRCWFRVSSTERTPGYSSAVLLAMLILDVWTGQRTPPWLINLLELTEKLPLLMSFNAGEFAVGRWWAHSHTKNDKEFFFLRSNSLINRTHI